MSISSRVFVVTSCLTPQMKAHELLYQSELYLQNSYAFVGIFPGNLPGNNGNKDLWRHSDVT